MVIFSESLSTKLSSLIKNLKKMNIKVVTAESCTGGLLSYAFISIEGASEVFERGFVSYSNKSKVELLTVPLFYIESYGAVSIETANAMAEGALLTSNANLSIAITGIAGPGGGTDEKPVGTVVIAFLFKGQKVNVAEYLFDGDRNTIQMKIVAKVVDILLDYLKKNKTF